MDRRRGELKPGTVLSGNYRIEKQIGAGGFAITYKGIQISNKVTVAIKEFFPVDSSVEMEREALGEILEEWQIAALMKAMMPAKSERYATMDEFLEAITFPSNETKPQTRIVSGRFERRPIGMGVFMGLTWAVLLAVVVYLVFFGRQGRLWTAVSDPEFEETDFGFKG